MKILTSIVIGVIGLLAIGTATQTIALPIGIVLGIATLTVWDHFERGEKNVVR